MRRLLLVAPLLTAACATVPPPAARPVEVQIIAFNDLHGNLEPPAPVEFVAADGTTQRLQTGGAAHLAQRVAELRRGDGHSLTVAAGDLIGATPLTSAWYLDEPTIEALNLIGLDYAAVGNHEFDKGWQELLRIQQGGCQRHTLRTPCGLEPYRGARFQYLAANVLKGDGQTLLPATALHDVGPVRIGLIGMTLKETGNLVTPSGVAGLSFADEAETANRLADELVAKGADAVVLLIHQGGRTAAFDSGQGCEALGGDIVPIVEKLKPSITTVISGHTHWAYVCQGGAGGTTGQRLLTSAGKNGYLVTDITLSFDPKTRALLGQAARNLVVGDGAEEPRTKALVDRYVAAVKPHAERTIGSLTAEAPNRPDDFESPAANLIADAYLAAAEDPAKGGAQLAIVNASGVRVTFPAGAVRYKDAFAVMPFGNTLVVKSFTGAQLKAILEQQYAKPLKVAGTLPQALAVSEGFRYALDLTRPAGDRVVAMTLGGRPVDPAATVRVVTNNYLASGGDALPGLAGGVPVTDAAGLDLDALVAWVAPGRTPPAADRIRLVGR